MLFRLFRRKIDVIVVGYSMEESHELVGFMMNMIEGEAPGYKFEGRYLKPNWTNGAQPMVAYIVRCGSKELAFRLRLKFKTLPSSDLSLNCEHLAGGSYG